MSKKRDKQNTETGSRPAGQANQKQTPINSGTFLNRFSHATLIIVLSIITWLCFGNSLNNLFTNWDDPGYILNDEVIRSLSLRGLKNIFTTPVMGHYHPLTILSYTIEYHFVQLDPWLYHFDSVLYHMVVVILVYVLAYLLTHSKMVALVTSILFSVHPMHAESVAWMSGRKDLLCALFFFAACILYLFFIRAKDQNKRWLWFTGVFVLYIAALLCKPIAVTLPIVLLLFDYYENRQWKISVLLEKIPLFIPALVFGLLSLKLNHAGEVRDVRHISYTFIERISLVSYALFSYIGKAVLPIGLHNFYTYPEKVNGSLPWYYYCYPFIIVVMVLGFWYYMRKTRAFVFGMLFFIVNIILLIKFVPVGEAILAERYTYTSYFGLFFISAVWLSNLWETRIVKLESVRIPITLLVVFCMIWYAYSTAQRCTVWHDNIALWSDEILKDPNDAEAYNNRGNEYLELKQYDNAIKDYSAAIQVRPGYATAFYDRGICYFALKRYDAAVKDYTDAIQIKPDEVQFYNNRGTAYSILKQYDSAIKDYASAIALAPADAQVYKNRGTAYIEQKQYDNGIKDYTRAIQIKPDYAEAFYGRGNAYSDMQQYNTAIKNYDTAIRIRPNDALAFFARGTAFAYLKDYDNAIRDYNSAILIQPDYADAYANRSLAYFIQKKYQLAIDDGLRARQLGARIDPVVLQMAQDNVREKTN